ncbi:hypothetical protein [Geobacillus stearothermophilus]|uniref:Uncharacterized protein n=1 Tax=Geobacillus stearothermophilus TaxID=1422 RepID=A0A150M8Y8_GEOSE|nr:hypothetical protein [Geobacillus stearothermophilus]KYD21033.1 hypothetical protein B4109_3238 [Geobacillus stearothermophilus]
MKVEEFEQLERNKARREVENDMKGMVITWIVIIVIIWLQEAIR